MNKLFTIVFAISFFIIGCDAVSEDVITDEGYDDIVTAKDISLNASNVITLYPENDKDYFKFDLPKGELLHISTNSVPANIQTNIKLYDNDGIELSSYVANKVGEDIAVSKILEQGVYWLSINDINNSMSDSTFSVILSRDSLDTLEYNNTIESAFEVNLGNIYSTKLFPYSDIDYFKIKTDKGHLLRVTTKGVPSDVKTSIKFFNDQNTQIQHWWSENAGDDDTATCIIDSGTYYVSISDMKYVGEAPSFKDEVFEISFTSDPLDTLEYNNSLEKAFAVKLGESYSTKLFPYSDISDFFKIKVDRGHLLKVTTDGIPSNIQPFIKFYDENGTIIQKKWADSAGIDCSAACVIDSGTYYVEIYDVSGQGADEPFIISFTSDSLDTLEYNDSIDQAFEVSFDTSYNAKLFPYSDKDYYTFSIQDSSFISISTFGIVSSIRASLSIYKELEYIEKVWANPEENNNHDLHFVRYLAPGNYHFLIEDYEAFGSDEAFSLRVSKF